MKVISGTVLRHRWLTLAIQLCSLIHIAHPIFKQSVSNLWQIGLKLVTERLTLLINVSAQAKDTIVQVDIKLFIM